MPHDSYENLALVGVHVDVTGGDSGMGGGWWLGGRQGGRGRLVGTTPSVRLKAPRRNCCVSSGSAISIQHVLIKPRWLTESSVTQNQAGRQSV